MFSTIIMLLGGDVFDHNDRLVYAFVMFTVRMYLVRVGFLANFRGIA